jgi:hypothetical protein
MRFRLIFALAFDTLPTYPKLAELTELDGSGARQFYCCLLAFDQIRGVMAAGRWYDQKAISEMLTIDQF